MPDLRRLFTVAALLAAVKLAGACKSIVCARAFGIGRELDCYLVAFTLVSLICDTVSGSLTPALIPTLAESTDRQSCYGGVLYCWCGVITAGALVVSSVDLFLYRVLAASFSAPELALTHRLLLFMTPMLPLSTGIAVFRAVLNTEGKLGLAAGAPILTPLVIFALIVSGASPHDIRIVAIGTTAGCAGELLSLAWTLRRLGYAILPRTGFTLPAGWLSRSYLPILASNFVGGTRQAVDSAVAASLGPGSLSALNLGTRLVAVASSIGPASVGTVLLPSFATAAAARDWKELRRQALRASMFGTGFGILIAASVWAFSRPLAYLVFHKAAALHLSVPALAHIQTVSFTQLPFAFLLTVLTRAAVAGGRNRLLFAVSVVSAAANLVFDLLCARSMGTAGVAFATTLVHAGGCLLLLPAVFTRSEFTHYLQNLGKKTGANLYAGPRVSE